MPLIDKEEIREMMTLWPDIVCDITGVAKDLNIPDVAKWMEEVLQYNVVKGKKIRGLLLIHAYKLLASSDELTEENIRLARILAWCLEIMQGSILLINDIIDQSLIRRGQLCWYRYSDTGEATANDGVLLKNIIHYMIQKHFKGKKYYVDLLETFHDILLKTVMGECLELFSTNFNKKPNLDLFTMDRYNSIAKYKISNYSFVLPVTAAMQLAGIKDPEMFKQAKTILLEMGHLFQVQDDYLACFGDPEVYGKDNTDIEEGKCTWLVVVALQRATPEQRQILEECYGSSDPEKVKCVKQLFIDLGLSNTYSTYEKETYNLLNVHIQQISCGLPHNLFLELLEQFYRRTS